MTQVKCGVYTITNIINGKVYVGSSENINRRWNNHRSTLNSNRHKNKKLQNSWNKYGENAFIFKCVLECDKSARIEKEQETIDAYKPWFNIRQIAKSNLGLNHSEETKAHLSKVKKGIPKSIESIEKQKAMLAKKNEDIRLGLREPAKRKSYKKRSAESRLAQSVRQKGKKPHPNCTNKGKTMSDEAKAKISTANKGRIKSKESIEKTSSKLKGRKHSEEAKLKMSKSRAGVPKTEAWKESRKSKSSGRRGVPISAEHKEKLNAGRRKQAAELRLKKNSD